MNRRFPPQLLSLIAITLLAHITMSGGRVTTSLYALNNGYPEWVAGIGYSLFSLLPAFLSLALGRWVDKVGPRKVMRISLMAMVGGLMLSFVWQSIILVLITAALAGLGFAAFILAANVAVGQLPAEDGRDRVGMFAWLQMGTSISAVVGPSLSGLMIDHAGFRWAFLSLAAIVALGLLMAYRIALPSQVREEVRTATPKAGIAAVVARDPQLLRIYGLAMALSLAWDAFAFMAPVLGHARGYSATSIGMVLSAFAVGTFSVRLVLPWLSRKLSELRMLSYTLAITAGAFLLLPLADSIVLLSLLGLLYGLAAGAGQPNILNLVYRTMPPGREGEGVGLRSMLGNIIGLCGPTLFGLISGAAGVAPVFLLVGGIMGVASWRSRVGAKQGLSTPRPS